MLRSTSLDLLPVERFAVTHVAAITSTPYAYITMKVRDIIKRIEEDGWYLTTTRGSHRQYEHPTKKGKVTVPGHLNDDLSPAMIISIFRQADLPRKG